MRNLNTKLTRGKIFSIILNFLIFAFSFVGIFLACYFASRDGYSHWYKRLLYFTQLSNIWIGVVSLIFAILLIKKDETSKSVRIVGILKYIFTISITLTGIVFCGLLAPFADFNLWMFSSVLTHTVVPLLSILDFFTNRYIPRLTKKHTLLSLIPPAAYFIGAGILCLLRVDFGRGDAFPYFFMDFYSEVGMFGFKGGELPQMGSFYWMVFFFLFIYLISFIYRILYNKIKEKPNKKTKA